MAVERLAQVFLVEDAPHQPDAALYYKPFPPNTETLFIEMMPSDAPMIAQKLENALTIEALISGVDEPPFTRFENPTGAFVAGRKSKTQNEPQRAFNGLHPPQDGVDDLSKPHSGSLSSLRGPQTCYDPPQATGLARNR